MRYALLTMLVIGWCCAPAAAQAPGQPAVGEFKIGGADPAFKDVKAQYSYAMGQNMARSVGSEVDFEMVIRGFKDAMSGAKPALSDQEMDQAMQVFQQRMAARVQQMQAQEMAKLKAEGDKHKQAGEAFLAANKKTPGVETFPSGMQVKVLKQGPAGPSPAVTSTATFHYRGTLLDGTEFDSSYARNEPLTYPINRLIKGWQEALPKMKAGDKWQLWIPGHLAYGDNPPGEIPPNATLVFEVELISFQ